MVTKYHKNEIFSRNYEKINHFNYSIHASIYLLISKFHTLHLFFHVLSYIYEF